MLDTNIILLMIADRIDAAGPAAAAALKQPHAERFVSVVSLWEIAIKVRLGKLALQPSKKELPDVVAMLGCRILPVTAGQVLHDVEPWPATRDPFDRLLLAICDADAMRLVTIDRQLRDHPLAWRPATA